MLNSILDDIKGTFRYGNNINKIILINVFVFLIVLLIRTFSPGTYSNAFYQDFISFIALPSDPIVLLKRPWTIITHMFLHEGFWHIFWNMLILFWFGQISGDLLGDKRVVPIYILGGFMGALFFVILAPFLMPGSIALGASAAVMAIVLSAAVTSPDYKMRLILIGSVSIKYIALFFILIDFFMIATASNTGGHIAHLGGAIFGALFVTLLRQGTDLADGFNQIIARFRGFFSEDRHPKTAKTIKMSRRKTKSKTKQEQSHQEKLDHILDKIKEKGFDQLTEEEKEFLFQASKK